MDSRKIILTIGLAVLLMVNPAHAQESSGDLEAIESELQSVCEVVDTGLECPEFEELCDGDIIDLSDQCLSPWVNTSFGFELHSCSGTKERVTEDSTTVGAGVAKGGPIYVGFVFANFQSTNKGWSWSFTCTLEFTVDVWAEGGGSIWREVAIYAESPSGFTKSEANCFYDGIVEDYCRTPTVISRGTQFTIRGSSGGTTDGYPGEMHAEGAAQGRNQPVGSGEVCIIHPPCAEIPSLGALIDSRVAIHNPMDSDVATIEWEDIGLIDDLEEIIDEVID